MKIAEQVVFESGCGVFSVDPAAGTAEIALDDGRDGETGIVIGAARCGKFSEADAPVGKLRTHMTDDGLVSSAEMARRIAFGCEYTVEREFELAGESLKVTTDVNAGMAGALRSLELEELFFAGNWEKVFLFDGAELQRLEIADGVFFRSEKAPLLLRFAAPDGTVVEYACGNDYWRQSAGGGEFALERSEDGIAFRRRVFQTAEEEAAPDRKNWRFKYLLAWKTPESGGTGKPAEKISASDAFGGMCMTSPAARKNFRSFVRSNASASEIVDCRTHFCPDAAHLERPGRKELWHYDLEDYRNFYVWANRSRRREGGEGVSFRFVAGSELENGAFAAMLGGRLF